MVGPGKIFKIEGLSWLENGILHLVVANSRAILLLFKVELIETVLDVLSYPTMGGPEKIFQIKGSEKAQNATIRWVFANTTFHKRAILLIF